MRVPTKSERLEQLMRLRDRVDAEIVRTWDDIHEGRRRTRKPFAECGSESGYRAHRMRGEETCEDCRRAHREAERRRAAKRRKRIGQAPGRYVERGVA